MLAAIDQERSLALLGVGLEMLRKYTRKSANDVRRNLQA